MEGLLRVNYALIWLFAALTLFGLYRPWLALWWLPVANRKKVLQVYGTAALVFAVTYLSLASTAARPPESALPRYLFYLHGRIVEDQGANAVSERYGQYEYDSIMQVFDRREFTVKGEIRTRDTDIHQYANHLTQQINELLDSGVAAEDITIVGASKGAAIAMLVSTNLQNPAVNFVLIAGCNDWVEENLTVNLCGRILSIYEASDEIGQSCASLFKHTTCPVTYREIKLDTGLEHGILYRPLPEWVEPTIKWALRE